MKRKKEERKYIIITFYQGNTSRMGAIKYADSQVNALLTARSMLHNTLNWQAIVYRWDDEKAKVESFVAEYNTIDGKII